MIVDLHFFLCPTGGADCEALRSKVSILMVINTAFYFSAQVSYMSTDRVSNSTIGRSEV